MKPALMVLLHADPFSAEAGGTEMHVLDRLASLALPRAVIVYPFTASCINATLITDGCIAKPEHFSFPLATPLLRYAHTHPEAEELMLRLARLFSAGAVSVEHALYFPLEFVRRLKQQGLPYVTVQHDFYCVCPSMNLMDIGTYQSCRAHGGEPQASAACLQTYFESNKVQPPCPADQMLAAHQVRWREILGNAEQVIFPSCSARDIVLASYPDVKPRCAVVPHGYASPGALPARPKAGSRLRVALIGQVAHKIKGRDLILELLGTARDLPVEWHFFGDVEYLNFMTKVDEIGAKRVFHGPYRREEIVKKLVSKVDVALFTSVCPETFSFTLSEALLAGVPVIVPRMGALQERVVAGQWGWVIDANSASAAAEILKELCGDAGKIEAMRRHLASFKHTTLAENGSAYAQIYAPLLRSAARAEPDESALHAAAEEYLSRKQARDAEQLAQLPEYKRSIFYGAYRKLKHLVPVSVRNGLYRLLVGKR